MKRVLVVDDVQDNITLLTFELEDDGFDVIAAYSGQECLDFCSANPNPDIILLDIRMPGLNGIETLQQLKSSEATADIPVVMVSANDTDEMIIQAIDLGAHDFVSKPIEYPVLAARMRSALRLSNALAELEKANIELEKLATKDPLTGSYNRRHFFTLTEKEVCKSIRHDRRLALMMLDIDHFKHINDTYGHATGDMAIQALVECCLKACRTSDILGRMGGEEFALCCPDADLEGAMTLAERIRSSCETMVLNAPNTTFKMTVSIGVTELTNVENLDEALHRADVLLYQAKRNGRNLIEGSLTIPEESSDDSN